MKNHENEVVKQILIPNKTPQKYFGVDFFARFYHGSLPLYQLFSSPLDPFQMDEGQKITAKNDFMKVFLHEISTKLPGMIIGFPQNPDPYNRLEETLMFMPQALQLLHKHSIGVLIETYSPLIIRDIPLLLELSKVAPVVVIVPVGFENEHIKNLVDPDSPSLAEREKLIHRLKEAGIKVGTILKPIIPYINDNKTQVISLVERLSNAGCEFAYPTFGISLSDMQRKQFFQVVDNEFPGLNNIYMDTFGEKQTWVSPNSNDFKKNFVFECKKRKIPYGMKEIIHFIKPDTTIQFKLF